jgi:hypothetical protein
VNGLFIVKVRRVVVLELELTVEAHDESAAQHAGEAAADDKPLAEWAECEEHDRTVTVRHAL